MPLWLGQELVFIYLCGYLRSWCLFTSVASSGAGVLLVLDSTISKENRRPRPRKSPKIWWLKQFKNQGSSMWKKRFWHYFLLTFFVLILSLLIIGETFKSCFLQNIETYEIIKNCRQFVNTDKRINHIEVLKLKITKCRNVLFKYRNNNTRK